MRRVRNVCLFAATILSPVFAQDASPPAPLPPAMQSAIDRLAKGGVSGEEYRVVLQNPPPANNVCSVPLLEMHVENRQRFTMQTVPAPAIDGRMPRVHGPAAACAPAQNATSAPAEPPVR